ncbi:MAG TPA: hypothetical protein VFS64_02010 [Solirubrobacterales bacterium]|nr:hypothetical protein [Solirubrobacterales bacterium]
MERTMWTDERLDDLAKKMDDGFSRLDRDIRDLRVLMFQLWGTNTLAILATIATVIATNN